MRPRSPSAGDPTREPTAGCRRSKTALGTCGRRSGHRLDLSLPSVLRHIVESAITLIDARYGALGVLDTAGKGLSEFVYVGMSPEQVAAIGRLPEGHGILGLLISEPEPLRLGVLGSHPDSFGFPTTIHR